MTTVTEVNRSRTRPAAVTRLLVTVRDPDTHSYRPVGFLDSLASGGFEFSYLQREVRRPDFRPLPGLARAVHGTVSSPSLFPLFAERVVSARRPDREVTLHALGLDGDAAPFEVLARSHGQRVGDTVELLPAPRPTDEGRVSFTFLAHGVRHLPAESQERITRLAEGEHLRLRRDAENPINPRALLVTDTDDLGVGWMPDPLIEVVESMSQCRLTVERSSGVDVGYHFRLLVRVDATVEDGLELFASEQWAVVAGGETIP